MVKELSKTIFPAPTLAEIKHIERVEEIKKLQLQIKCQIREQAKATSTHQPNTGLKIRGYYNLISFFSQT